MKHRHFITLIVTIFWIQGCNHSDHPIHKEESNITIATFTPTLGTYTSKTTVSAVVQPSPQGIVFVSSPVEGTIHSVNIHVGSHVKASTPLATIRSSEASDTQSLTLQAQATYDQAKRIYAMNQELANMGAVTHNELLASQTAFKQATALLKGTQEKLAYMGASSSGNIMLRSPLDGVVYEITTHVGEKVTNDPQQPLIKIANPKSKLIVATLYEKDLVAFKKGEKVMIHAPSIAPLGGIIDYVSDVVDPINKTVNVTIKPERQIPELKLNMFVKVSVDAPYPNVYRIPKKSILFKEGKFIVFVKHNDKFIPTPITVLNDDTVLEYSLVEGIKPQSIIASEAIAMERQ